MIRHAKIGDVVALLDLIEAALAKSQYAGSGEIDRDYAGALLRRSMHFSGKSAPGSTLILVSEADGKIEGYFLGVLDRVYQLGKPLAANEVHFYLSENADARDAIRILDAFEAWADSNDRVIEKRIGASNFMGEPDPRFAALLERRGFTKGATVFSKGVTK